MSQMTNFLEQEIGDELFRAVAFASPDTYLALYTVMPGEAGGGTEVTGGAYARQLVENDGATTPYWNTYAAGIYDNNGEIAFPQASAGWGTCVGMTLMSAVTAGNFLIWGPLGSAHQIFVGTNVDNRINAPGHGRSEDDLIIFGNTHNGLPTGVTEWTVEYFAINITADDFQISLTAAPGSPVAITVDGDGTFWLSQYRTVNINETFRVPTGQLDITML